MNVLNDLHVKMNTIFSLPKMIKDGFAKHDQRDMTYVILMQLQIIITFFINIFHGTVHFRVMI